MTQFYGYKHWTLEETSRCFYVGKGIAGRERSKRSRNHKWHAIVKRYGIRIEMCKGPVTNEEACAWEIEQIEFESTFSINHSHDDSSDINCNFTRGGEGSIGCVPNDETRQKMSHSHVGNTSGHACAGKSKSEAHKQAISNALKGNPKVSAALKGNKRTLGLKMSTETLQKRSKTQKLNNQRRKFLHLLVRGHNE